MSACLTHYPAQRLQRPHQYGVTEVSFLLAGAMTERLEGHDYEMHGTAVGTKPAGSLREDMWGEQGALNLLPEVLAGRSPADSEELAPNWSPLQERSTVAKLVTCCLLSLDTECRSEAADDLLAMLDKRDKRGWPGAPP